MEPIDQAKRFREIFGDLAVKAVKEIIKAKGGSWYWTEVKNHLVK